MSGRDNLQPGTAEAAARAREGLARRWQETEAAMARVEARAQEGDTVGVLREMLDSAARAAIAGYRKFNRSRGTEPPATLMGLSREVRALVDRVLEYHAEDHDAVARRWFQRLEEASRCRRCGTLLHPPGVPDVVPLIEIVDASTDEEP